MLRSHTKRSKADERAGTDSILNIEVEDLPMSITYLHRLALDGQANVYSYTERAVTIKIVPADAFREPSLTEVQEVVLSYGRGD